MQIQIFATDGANRTQLAVIERNPAQGATKYAVKASQKITVVIDGLALTGEQLIGGKKLKLARSGNNLLIQAEDGTENLIELTNFYETPYVLLDGDQWAWAQGSELELVTGGVTYTAQAAALAPSAWAGMAYLSLGLGLVGAALAGGSGRKATAPPDPKSPPEPTTYQDDVGTVMSGTSKAITTDDNKPGINVGAGLNPPPTLYVNGIKVDSRYEPNTGTLTPIDVLPDGLKALTYTLSNSGKESPQSQPLNLTVDTKAPSPPTAEVIGNGAAITGTAEPGATVTVTLPDGTKRSALASANGSYSILLSPLSFTNGEVGKVVATDAAGNESKPVDMPLDLTTPFLDVIETSLTPADEPATAIMATAMRSSVNQPPAMLAGDGFLNAAERLAGLTLTGTTEPGRTVKIVATGTGTDVTVLSDPITGAWKAILPTNNWPFSGDVPIIVTSTDGLNTATVTRTVRIDTQAPATPTAALAHYADNAGTIVNASSTAATTDDTTPGLKIGASLTDTPKLYVDGVFVASFYNSSEGTLTPLSQLAEGSRALSFALTDAAGNESGTSPTLNLTVDTRIPTTIAVNIPEAADRIINALEASDGVAVVVTLPLQATAGDVITVSIAGRTPVSYTVKTDDLRKPTVTLTLTQADIRAAGDQFTNIVTTYKDAAGNTSTPVITFVEVDLTAPTATPAPTNYVDNVGAIVNASSTAATTDDTTPGLKVGASLTDTPKLYVDGVFVASSYNSSEGTLTPLSQLTEGARALSFTLTDAAGNESGRSQVFNLTVDTSALIPPKVTVPENAGGIDAVEASDGVDVVVTLPSDARAGDVITVSIDGSKPVSHTVTAANLNTSSPQITLTLPVADITAAGDGPATIVTTYTDAAGNVVTPVQTQVTLDRSPTLASTPSTFSTTKAGTPGDSTGETVVLTIEFSEAVLGLTSGTNNDVFLLNGSGTSATWGGTGASTTRTLTYTVLAGQNGAASINESNLTSALRTGITDLAGNAFVYAGTIPNIDTVALSRIDTTAPTLTIVGDGSSGSITLTFSETPVDFGVGDIVVNNGTKGALTQSSTNLNVYSLAVTPSFIATNTNIAVDVNAGTFTDAAGNANMVKSENTTTIASTYKERFMDNIAGLDTSNVTNFNSAFENNSTFNQNIGGWDTARAEQMNLMFAGASAFNQDISGWVTSAVTSMGATFFHASKFNQNISGWNTSNVIKMGYMFDGATDFNQEIGTWDTSKVQTMDSMFSRSGFNGDIGEWKTGNVKNMSSMFMDNKVFDQDIGNWDTSKVTNMARMFQGTVFNKDLSWETSNVTDMSSMFFSATNFNQDIGDLKTSKVGDMSNMFSGATSFNQDIGQWNVSSLTTASDFLTNSGMSMANVDQLLAGWSDINFSRGELGLQSGATLGLNTTYSDATSLQYLTDTYGWNVSGTLANTDAGVWVGGNSSSSADSVDLSAFTTAVTIHGLGGNDILRGGSVSDLIVGGAGNDMLTGGAGSDTFRYQFLKDGADTITDFSNIDKAEGGDVLDISYLLDRAPGSTAPVSDFIAVENVGTGQTRLNIDANGQAAGGTGVSITLSNVTYNPSATFVDEMIARGNLVL